MDEEAFLKQEIEGLKCEVSHWQDKYTSLLFEMEKLIINFEIDRLRECQNVKSEINEI